MSPTLTHLHKQAAVAADAMRWLRAAQLAIQAQYTLTLSRIVDVDDRVGEIAACEALLGEVCEIIGRACRLGAAAQDTLAPAEF